MIPIDTSLAEKLDRLNQSHLLQFWNALNLEQQKSLEAQVLEIDFELIARLHEQFGKNQQWAELAQRAEPPAALRLDDAVSDAGFSRDDAIGRGEQALAQGKVAMLLVAGGQGSRLGFNHPKGLLEIGPVSGRSLFQVQIEKLLARAQRFGVTIPLYVMSSPPTHDEIVEYLKQNDWFNYPRSHATVFCQGTMPAVDAETGKLLLSAQGELFLSPDGHGGTLSALDQSGCLDNLNERGIEQVFYCQIDNPMVPVCDPATIGCHLISNSEMTLQGVAKTDALQRVGNIVSIDGKVQIIEYSDLPAEVAQQTDDDGSLRLWAGSIAVHVFETSFLNRMTQHADALPFHLAHKKVPYIDNQGNRVQPDAPNAIKFERFIFDLLPRSRQSFVVEVDPQEAFAPVKNAASEATETAATSRRAMINQARRLLRSAGATIGDDVDIELCPFLAEDPQKLSQRIREMGPITQPTYLQ